MGDVLHDYPFTAAVLDGRERWALVDEDASDFLRKLPDCSIDAVVTDPPAGVNFMGKEWDGDKGGRDQWVAWLGGILAECLRVLTPGGHALVWSLPRTSHWTAWALEQAGFEIRDCVYHIFGSGFPKSMDVAKAIDKKLGAERPVIGEKAVTRVLSTKDVRKHNYQVGVQGRAGTIPLTAPGSVEAEQWEGWGTALKPAAECWWLVRKPLEKGLTVAENVLKWGTGALNISGCRIATTPGDNIFAKNPHTRGGFGHAGAEVYGQSNGADTYDPNRGRWPAHVVLQHDADCELIGTKKVKGITGTAAGKMAGKSTDVYGKFNGSARAGEPTGYVDADGTETVEDWRCVPGCPIREMDRQSNDAKSRASKPRKSKEPSDNDQGGASRFFYVAKPSRKEREAGLDTFESVPKDAVYGDGLNSATKIRTEEQAEDGVDRGGAKNNHPTVKSIELMRYLCRLITPPNGIVLDPFAGSGSTGCAALLEGFRFVGIEREKDYVAIATARIMHWETQAPPARAAGSLSAAERSA